TPNTNPMRGLQVVALGEGLFRIVIYQGGLPGAGWDGKAPQIIDEEERPAVQELIEDLSLAKIHRQSPTLNAVPPEDAIVLFDGTRETFEAHWESVATMTADGLLTQGATTTDTFQDYTLHLEFRTPYQP